MKHLIFYFPEHDRMLTLRATIPKRGLTFGKTYKVNPNIELVWLGSVRVTLITYMGEL